MLIRKTETVNTHIRLEENKNLVYNIYLYRGASSTDRVPDFESVGCGFESHAPHQKQNPTAQIRLLTVGFFIRKISMIFLFLHLKKRVKYLNIKNT